MFGFGTPITRDIAYQQGRSYYRPGMAMSRSDDCPHPIQGGASEIRIGWMSGFFDAYFQRLCDVRGWGKWGV